MVTGHKDGSIKLWDTEKNQQIGELENIHGGIESQPYKEYRSEIYKLAFSPDGQYLFSVGAPGKIVMWDMTARLPLCQPFGTMRGLGDLIVGPAGKTLMTTGDETIIWDVDPESWKKLALRIASRDLTREEWRRLMGEEP